MPFSVWTDFEINEVAKLCLDYGLKVAIAHIERYSGFASDEMMAQDDAVIPKIMHLEAPNTVAHMMYLRYNYYMDHPEDPLAPKLRPDRGYDFVFPDREYIRRAVHLDGNLWWWRYHLI